MTVKYYAILTNQGAARLANATMLGSKLNLTQMAVGDANGVLPTPDPAQTKLINQKRIAPLNLLSVDPNNQSQIIAEQIIPENEGGFWIREIGLYDDEGVLIAVANCPETYKPQLQEGSGRTQTIRMILVVTNTEAITLKIDPSVVLATRKYVDDEVLELKLYVDDQMRNHIAAQDPHTQYAQKHNPTFTGEPKAPTPAAGNNTTRIATTEFVQAAVTALINGAPATLDTLKEIAAAINNDPKFSTTINNVLSGKQPLDETLTHLSGKDVAGLLAYLGLEETINRAADALQKSQNGADIPDKPRFVQNIGLKETLNPTKRVSIGNIGTGVFDGSTPCINIGDSDSGFIGSADGVLDIYCNAAKVGYIDGNGLHMLTDIHFDNARMTTNGDIFGSVWGNNWLSIWITNQLNTRGTIDWINSELAVRDNNINTRATWDYVNQTFARKNTGSIQDWGWILDDSTGFIMQWGTLGNSNGTYNFPRAFPVGCFAVFVTNTNAQGTQVDNAFGYPVSNSQFFAATKSSGMANLVNNFPVAWLALGR
ncbi:phage tail protein [Salmonella enterica subsp. enterica serovar Typhimurium]|uniref:Phage tail protein n=38 Tax=Enterobacteriaceae TaxID=543 RepID=A0A601ZV43_SALDE|nr:phage tail protein [Salmonella enterica]EAA2497609.1 phage tail protein [Salmonella enterica subsp. enterica]EBV6709630.1 phage tail protein [Salmonella enterica subsp. enterica serovar Saintpaul]ECC3720931.1 phage tail protein [Salmonella enterica subsp. enterica serovar 4,[5],12:r:-]EDF8119147.1 phage tail protein [Salmonella enterica subsp. enterica serovar Agona]EHE2145615.1 phage tail protein [Salmonella enterica subsp. enterica serovar Brandenburg]EYI70709.1 phage tail fiber protein 